VSTTCEGLPSEGEKGKNRKKTVFGSEERSKTTSQKRRRVHKNMEIGQRAIPDYLSFNKDLGEEKKVLR